MEDHGSSGAPLTIVTIRNNRGFRYKFHATPAKSRATAGASIEFQVCPQGPAEAFHRRLEVRQTACVRCFLACIMIDAGTVGRQRLSDKMG